MKIPAPLLIALTSALFISMAVADDDEKERNEKDSHGHALAAPVSGTIPPASSRQGLTYEADIKPLLKGACFRCHGEDKQKGDLRLDSLQAVLAGGEEGKVVIIGSGARSPLVISSARIDPDTAMPPMKKVRNGQNPPSAQTSTAKVLTPEQVGILRAWIDQGAR